jgi:hypothetical protein
MVDGKTTITMSARPSTSRRTFASSWSGVLAIVRMGLAIAFVTFVGLSTYQASTQWLAEASVAADDIKRDLLDSTLNYAALN